MTENRGGSSGSHGKSGTVFGLLGANGAGKSTTIECMLGTKQADTGTVRLLGQAPEKHRRQLFQRIGVQFQEGNYHPEIKVSELCEETASLYRSPADWRKLCQQFGIGGKCGAAVKVSPAVSGSGSSSCWRCSPGRSWYFWMS